MTVPNPKAVNIVISHGVKHNVRAHRVNTNQGAQFLPHRGRLGILCKKLERLRKPFVIALGLFKPERCGAFQVDLNQVLFG